MEEKGITLFQHVKQALSVGKTVKSARSRSDKARQELAEAESVEQLIEGLFMFIDEILEEVEKAGISQQRATTRMRNIAKERKAQLESLLKEE